VRLAANTIAGVTSLSPTFGFPQNGKVGDPGFRCHPDAAMIAQAHARG
jgi:glycerophosphoryl diester phosphodiesterase